MGLEDLKSCIERIEENLIKRRALVFGIFLCLAFILFVDSLVIDFANFIGLRVRPLFYTLIIVLWVLYWIQNKYRLPRNGKKKTGIVIAMYSENEKERKRLKSDFISKLKKDLQSEDLSSITNIIFLKNHFADRINSSDNPKKTIEKMNKKIKADFYVRGDIKKRLTGEEGSYFISFQGYVVHDPISVNLSRQISLDFSTVLPRQVKFLANRSFEGFETSAEMVHLAAKYIIGLAAFVSHNPSLAFRLHSGLKEKFIERLPLLKGIKRVVNRLPRIISDEALRMSKRYYESGDINKTKEYLRISLNENPNNYGTWLFKAILDFQIYNDSKQALTSISKAKKNANRNIEWRYSEAFLYFSRKNYKKAINVCNLIKNQSYSGEDVTLQEVKKFVMQILDKEDMPQLYFRLGYLEYFKCENLGNALDYFEKFELLADNEMGLLKNKASAYLREIKKTIGI